jgi:hypothetical protein
VVQKNTTRKVPSAQISRSKAQATKIRAHSCSFVVQKNITREDHSGEISGSKARAKKFVFIRVHSWFKTTPTQGPRSTDLALESPSYKNSCPFVSIRGSKNITREVPSGQILGSKAQATKIRAHSCPFVVQKNTSRKIPAAHISGSKAQAT